jgi:pimeloyl-ACP methyl ester carboxylesterase
MATFLLIHGAWFGGWIWKRVTPLLRAAGHEVLTPTLTGLGERAHLARPEVSLHTHVQDVLGVLAYEDVRGVVLVGWSYAGMVITAVAEQAADRLAHLVYLDASVPEDGQAALDLLDPATRAAREARVRTEGEGWQMLPPPVEQFGITAEADARWVRPKLVAQPFKTYQEPVRLTNAAARALPRTYISCTVGPWTSIFAPFARKAQAEGWRYRELATGHAAPVLEPQKLADLLLEVV